MTRKELERQIEEQNKKLADMKATIDGLKEPKEFEAIAKLVEVEKENAELIKQSEEHIKNILGGQKSESKMSEEDSKKMKEDLKKILGVK